MNIKSRTALLASLMAATFAMSACDKSSTTLGQKVDGAVASSERAASAAKAEVKETMNEVKASASDASSTMAAKTQDGLITTKVNAELVKDPALSALKINVETSNASVALNGAAPSEAARERATTLALGVEGVKAVDNRLVVEAKK